MKKTNKRGYTIVELVVTITVIAILAAVLIPTFVGLIKKANVSSDIQLIRNMNIALATDNEKHTKMQDAMECVREAGIDPAKVVVAQEGNKILWDSVNDVFCYYNADESEIEYTSGKSHDKNVENDCDYWEIMSEINDNTRFKYSVYWNSEEDFGSENSPVTMSVGFDAGDSNGNQYINYVKDGSTEQNVIINTAGGTLVIDAGHDRDSVDHYGYVDTLSILDIGNYCYHEYGSVGTVLAIEEGTLIFESGSKMHQTKDEISEISGGSGVKVEIKNGAAFGVCIFDGWTVITPAGCKDNGEEAQLCVICGEANEETKRPISAVGYHSWDEGVYQPADENSIAGKKYTCHVCKAERFEAVFGEPGDPSCDHSFGETVTMPAGCVSDGYKYQVCTKCSFIDQIDTIPATGEHTYGEYEVVESETCTTAGMQKRICSECKVESFKIVAALGHDFDRIGAEDVEWTVSDDGNSVKARVKFICDRENCEENLDFTVAAVKVKSEDIEHKEVIIYSATFKVKGDVYIFHHSVIKDQVDHAHEYGDEITVAPGCGEFGYVYKVCSCGNVEMIEILKPTGNHTWEIKETTATCTKPGDTKKECTECHVTIEETGSALGHDYEQEEIIWADDFSEVTVTFGCKREGCDYTGVVKQAVPTKTEETDEYIIYSAEVKMEDGTKITVTTKVEKEDPNKCNHEYGDTWSWMNGTSHSRVCTKCNNAYEYGTHTNDNGSCAACGAVVLNTVVLYDTWNKKSYEFTMNDYFAPSAEREFDWIKHNVISLFTAEAAFPANWVFASDEKATIADGSLTLNGTLLAKAEGDGYVPYGFDTIMTYNAADENCYQMITTKAGFTSMNSSSGLTKRYVQANDLTLGSINPIGWLNSGDTAFSGIYDGCGKTVSYSLTKNGSNTGLWAGNRGIIKNVVAKATSTVTSYMSYIGGFVGRNLETGIIDNCHVEAVVNASLYGNPGSYYGGVVGYNLGIIKNTYHKGNLTNSYQTEATLLDAGGFVGYNNGVINNCINELEKIVMPHVYNDLVGADAVGGFVGLNDSNGVIEDCKVKFTNTAEQNVVGYVNVGGFVGLNRGTIKWCSVGVEGSAPVIQGHGKIGGFVGQSGGTIEYCAAVSQVKCLFKTTYSGDYSACYYYSQFCGLAAGGSIKNSYAIASGPIIGNDRTSGFATVNTAVVIENCYTNISYGYRFFSNTSGYDVIRTINGSCTPSNCYVIAIDNKHVIRFEYMEDNSTLLAAASKNQAWIDAGVWDFSGSYPVLKDHGDVISDTDYTITLDSNLDGVDNSEIVGKGNSKVNLPAFEADDYTFLGWATSDDATEAEYAPGAEYKITGNATLYGVWQVEITVLPNTPDGMNQTTVDQVIAAIEALKDTVVVGQSFTATSLTGGKPLDGYIHIGYAIENGTAAFTLVEDAAAEVDIWVGDTITVEEPITLKAIWLDVSALDAGTALYFAGKAEGNNYLKNIPTSSNGKISSSVPTLIPDDASFTNPTAWSFIGWRDIITGEIYHPSDKLTGDSVRLLVAQWETGCYVVAGADEYKAFADSVKNGNKYTGKTVILGADVDLKGEGVVIGNTLGDDPINGYYGFNGRFNGNGFTVKNISENSSRNIVGMFTTIGPEAIIENLTIENCHFVCGGAVFAEYMHAGIVAAGCYYTPNVHYRNIHIKNSSAKVGNQGGNTTVWGYTPWSPKTPDESRNCTVE